MPTILFIGATGAYSPHRFPRSAVSSLLMRDPRLHWRRRPRPSHPTPQMGRIRNNHSPSLCRKGQGLRKVGIQDRPWVPRRRCRFGETRCSIRYRVPDRKSLTPVTRRRLTRSISDFQADADHLEGTKAILRGLKARFQETGVAPILIHTVSATSIDDIRIEPHRSIPLSSLALAS